MQKLLCTSVHVAAEAAAPGRACHGHSDISDRINAERASAMLPSADRIECPRGANFDHLVGNGENSQWNCQGEHVRNLEEIEITNSNVVGSGWLAASAHRLAARAEKSKYSISSDLIRPRFGANAIAD